MYVLWHNISNSKTWLHHVAAAAGRLQKAWMIKKVKDVGFCSIMNYLKSSMRGLFKALYCAVEKQLCHSRPWWDSRNIRKYIPQFFWEVILFGFKRNHLNPSVGRHDKRSQKKYTNLHISSFSVKMFEILTALIMCDFKSFLLYPAALRSDLKKKRCLQLR